MDVFDRSMTSLHLEDYCTEHSLGKLIKNHLCISNQQALQFSINKDQTELKIDAN